MSAHDVPLTAWPLGEPAVLVAASCPPRSTGTPSSSDLTMVLARLGLRLGMRVTPVQRTPGRGLLLAVDDLRLAVDRGSAESLFVHAPVSMGPGGP